MKKILEFIKQIQEQQSSLTGKIWIKKVTVFDENSLKWPGWAFVGNTFEYKDCFKELNTTQPFAKGTAKFHFNKHYKAWVTTHSSMYALAVDLLKKKTGGTWKGNLLTFKKGPKIAKPDSALSEKEIQHIRSIWGDKHQDFYSQEASTIDANKAWYCPSCGTPIDHKKVVPHKDFEGEITHETYRCPKCSSKMKIFND